MTATKRRQRTVEDGRLNVYGASGEVIATVNHARSEWLGTLLAECDRHHVYVLTDAVVGCPRCRVLGHV